MERRRAAMARRRGLEPWQAKTRDTNFLIISYDIMKAPAFKELSGRQIRLYLFAMQRRFFSIARSSREQQGATAIPAKRWPGAPQISCDCFFLNAALVISAGLYSKTKSKSGAAALRGDIKKLVEVGLLDIVLAGKNGEKSVYKMSERWKEYGGRSPPETYGNLRKPTET